MSLIRRVIHNGNFRVLIFMKGSTNDVIDGTDDADGMEFLQRELYLL